MTNNLDLTTSSTQSVTFQVERNAVFNSTLDFYPVNGDGSVIDPTSGNSIAPGEEGYGEAAIANRLNLDLRTDNGVTSTFSANLAGGVSYAPIVAVNSDFQALEDGDNSNDPLVYFSFVEANADGFEHFQSNISNQFNFEDLFSGGDQDFDDLIVNFELEDTETEPSPDLEPEPNLDPDAEGDPLDERPIEDPVDETPIEDSPEDLANSIGSIDIFISSPSSIVADGRDEVTVTYINNGDTEAISPLLNLEAEGALLRPNNGTEFSESEIQFLGISNEGQAGVIAPGESNSFTVQFMADGTCLLYTSPSPRDS